MIRVPQPFPLNVQVILAHPSKQHCPSPNPQPAKPKKCHADSFASSRVVAGRLMAEGGLLNIKTCFPGMP